MRCYELASIDLVAFVSSLGVGSIEGQRAEPLLLMQGNTKETVRCDGYTWVFGYSRNNNNGR